LYFVVIAIAIAIALSIATDQMVCE
jgi:hypothetical protein